MLTALGGEPVASRHDTVTAMARRRTGEPSLEDVRRVASFRVARALQQAAAELGR
jgi:hypothetical protein